jgi:hypothetical protein
MRLHFNTEDACVWYDDYKINLRTQAAIPRSKVKRMQCDPIVRARGKQVEDIPLSRRCAIVHK